MLTFLEYANERNILRLIIKERVKVALKKSLKGANNQEGHISPIAKEVAEIMPPRNSWVRPRKQERLCASTGDKRTNKQILMRSVALTIKAHRKNKCAYPYLERLDTFIKGIQSEIISEGPLSFAGSIHIIGRLKKVDSEGVHILRPICTFNSLRDKILISLTNSYLSEVFDPLLHEEVLAYRPIRFYHDSQQKVLTNRDNAIANLQTYRQRFAKRGVYVAECDIQKYFDTINHDVIRRYFDNFATQVERTSGDFGYKYARRIIDAYLHSYSFYKNVAKENNALSRQKPQKRYEVPNAELFIERGCYTPEEFAESQEKIGIPQGGALSGLISNVILSSIDKQSVLTTPDPRLFFSRYGDDILLMHPSKERCQQLIEAYRNALTQNKLLYHEFVDVADEGFMRTDGRTLPSLWDQKSRKPFLWGRDKNEKSAMDWIGFLGYEVRYTGEVRLRCSSFDDKMKKIKRQYHKATNTKLAKGQDQFRNTEEMYLAIERKIDYLKTEGLAGAKSLNRNKYSITQAIKLNAYTNRHIYKMLYKITKQNGLTSEQFDHFWQLAKDKQCANYTRTITK